MRLDKFIHYIKQSRSQKRHTIIHSNQYKDECNIHEFREQQKLIMEGLILRRKSIYEEVISVLRYQNLVSTTHGRI